MLEIQRVCIACEPRGTKSAWGHKGISNDCQQDPSDLEGEAHGSGVQQRQRGYSVGQPCGFSEVVSPPQPWGLTGLKLDPSVLLPEREE